MITPTEYIQLKAFARQDGLFIGCLWVAAFACFIGSMTHPELQLGFVVGTMATPFAVYYRLRHFRDKILDGYISFRRAFAFIAFTMAYASIILAGATLVYFYFLDNGMFVATLRDNLSIPEIQQSFVNAGMDPKVLDVQLETISKSRPIDFAISIFSDGLISSLILALIIGFLGKRAAR